MKTLKLLVLLLITFCHQCDAQDFMNFSEAYSVGAKRINMRKYKESISPLESALKLAETDKDRIRCYQALKFPYRMLPAETKMIEAVEFIMSHTERVTERNLAGRDLLSFLFQRGKIEFATKRYEALLQKEKENTTALYMLSEIYEKVTKDPERATEMLQRLVKVDAKSAPTPADGKKMTQAEVLAQGRLAASLVRSRQFQKGAELFEKIAPHLESTEAWHWKEAALAWSRINEQKKSLSALSQAIKVGPDTRSDQLTHFWYRQIGDLYVSMEKYKMAIPMFEKAIEFTEIEGYIDGCKKSIQTCKEKL